MISIYLRLFPNYENNSNTNRNRTNEEEVPYHVPLVVVSPSLTPQHTPILPHRTPENGDQYDAETSTMDADTVQKDRRWKNCGYGGRKRRRYGDWKRRGYGDRKHGDPEMTVGIPEVSVVEKTDLLESGSVDISAMENNSVTISTIGSNETTVKNENSVDSGFVYSLSDN